MGEGDKGEGTKEQGEERGEGGEGVRGGEGKVKDEERVWQKRREGED